MGSSPIPKPAEPDTDGRIGPNTLRAITAVETVVMGLPESAGIVAPGDATIQALLRGLPPGPSEKKLAVVLPLAVESRIATFYQPLVEGMTSYAITSPLQMAHFLAQIGLESGNFLTPKSWPAIRWWRWMPPAGSGTSRTT